MKKVGGSEVGRLGSNGVTPTLSFSIKWQISTGTRSTSGPLNMKMRGPFVDRRHSNWKRPISLNNSSNPTASSHAGKSFYCQPFHNLVSAAEAADLYNPVTLTELKNTLFLLKKEKSPGPDGWTAEFFTHFFDLVGSDLLLMVEDARIKGKISSSLNSTFLVLIPKKTTLPPSTISDRSPFVT
jgi:hypothetical protein